MQRPIEAARPGGRLALIVRRDVGSASWAGWRALRGLARDRVEGAERAGVAHAGRRFSLVYLPVSVEVQCAHERVGAAARSPMPERAASLYDSAHEFFRFFLSQPFSLKADFRSVAAYDVLRSFSQYLHDDRRFREIVDALAVGNDGFARPGRASRRGAGVVVEYGGRWIKGDVAFLRGDVRRGLSTFATVLHACWQFPMFPGTRCSSRKSCSRSSTSCPTDSNRCRTWTRCCPALTVL